MFQQNEVMKKLFALATDIFNDEPVDRYNYVLLCLWRYAVKLKQESENSNSFGVVDQQ